MNSCYVRLCSAGRKTDQGATQKERLSKRSKDIAHEIPRRIGKSVAVVKAESIATHERRHGCRPLKDLFAVWGSLTTLFVRQQSLWEVAGW